MPIEYIRKYLGQLLAVQRSLPSVKSKLRINGVSQTNYWVDYRHITYKGETVCIDQRLEREWNWGEIQEIQYDCVAREWVLRGTNSDGNPLRAFIREVICVRCSRKKITLQ